MTRRGRIARICRTLGAGVPLVLTLAGAGLVSTSAVALVQAGAISGQAPVVEYSNGGFEWG
jgi:hypothetical protein